MTFSQSRFSLPATIAAGIFAIGTAIALPAAAAAQNVGLPIGTQGPAAVVETLAGEQVDLADYVGKGPVLIQFWATWCSNCRDLEPAMRAAKARYGDRVKFLGVAVSVNQSPARVKAYHEQHKLPLEVFYDRSGKATDVYEAPATSYVVVLDAAGKVVYTGVGGKQNIEAALARAVGG